MCYRHLTDRWQLSCFWVFKVFKCLKFANKIEINCIYVTPIHNNSHPSHPVCERQIKLSASWCKRREPNPTSLLLVSHLTLVFMSLFCRRDSKLCCKPVTCLIWLFKSLQVLFSSFPTVMQSWPVMEETENEECHFDETALWQLRASLICN